MDTLIGNYKLSDNQIANLITLNIPVFKGFNYQHDTGDMTGVSLTQPSPADIASANTAINALSNTLDKSVLEARFDVNLLLLSVGQAFTGVDAVNLAPYLGAVQSYAAFKDFAGVKAFLAGLVALGKATQAQSDTIYAIFLQQGIDLNTY